MSHENTMIFCDCDGQLFFPIMFTSRMLQIKKQCDNLRTLRSERRVGVYAPNRRELEYLSYSTMLKAFT